MTEQWRQDIGLPQHPSLNGSKEGLEGNKGLSVLSKRNVSMAAGDG